MLEVFQLYFFASSYGGGGLFFYSFEHGFFLLGLLKFLNCRGTMCPLSVTYATGGLRAGLVQLNGGLLTGRLLFPSLAWLANFRRGFAPSQI
jgi:hypothetical protein